ncbi:MAG: hypothetical protein JW976_07150 [Syntrophaceae bacterium]|nr:hypothetical protein [Syntrophaceae bacterium]
MTFTDAVREILLSANRALTPQEIRKLIKERYPEFYKTESHINNVQKGYYKDEDHALLVQIYGVARTGKSFFYDKSHKPAQVSLISKKTVSLPEPVMPHYKSKIMKNEDDLIQNIKYYYERSLGVLKEFGGPSIYFHVQAIREQETSFLSDRHIEMIYATLASWGMHRMGDPEETKAKMVEFADFKRSIIKKSEDFQKFYKLRMDSCTLDQYEKHIDSLKNIYFALKVSISDATIVAHSKTLAHILPNLIPPIDRQYTIRFFTQDNKDFFTKSGNYRLVYLPQKIDAQFDAFKKYACKMKAIFDSCDNQLFEIDKNTFNTSYPKIIDNLIMAFVKEIPKPEKNRKKEIK